MKLLKSFDDYFIKLINANIKNRYLDKLMPRVTDLGGAVFISVFSLGLVIFGKQQYKIMGLEAILALLIGQVFVHTLKKLLSRERPYNILKHLNTFGIELRDYSFPSGHTTASFCLATIIALNIPKFAIGVIILAIIIALSRVYLGVHYPTDVVAGIALGVITALVTHFYLHDFVLRISSFLRITGRA